MRRTRGEVQNVTVHFWSWHAADQECGAQVPSLSLRCCIYPYSQTHTAPCASCVLPSPATSYNDNIHFNQYLRVRSIGSATWLQSKCNSVSIVVYCAANSPYKGTNGFSVRIAFSRSIEVNIEINMYHPEKGYRMRWCKRRMGEYQPFPVCWGAPAAIVRHNYPAIQPPC